MKIIYKDGVVAECPEEQKLQVIRHTAAHIMAQAIQRLYPEADFGYGPATENGFYYDVDLGDKKIADEDLAAIEAEMKKIIKENLPIKPFILPREEAKQLMKERNAKYKLEHIDDLPEDAEISFFKQGDYIDMCIGPHLTYTKALKAFKLTQSSGAYWKGDKDNKMLTRINGIAFATQDELDAHLKLMEEAARRDHRKVGKEMKLFMMRDEAIGFPFFLPNGMNLKNTLIEYWRELHRKNGYVEISTPLIMNRKLWETSGHWDHYKNNMYSTMIDEEINCVKPMNCPGGVLVYASEPHSYRELPIRAGELGIVHRHELRGALHGLMRVRCFTQDDAHIFMRPDQITDEIMGVVHLINEVYHGVGFLIVNQLAYKGNDAYRAHHIVDAFALEYEVFEGFEHFRRHGSGQVALVQRCNQRDVGILQQRGLFRIHFSCGIHHHQHHIRLFQLFPRAVDADALHFIRGIAQTRGINQLYRQTV